MIHHEGNLAFDVADGQWWKFDEFERTIRAVDFMAQFEEEIWFVECKQVTNQKELKSDQLLKKHILPKLYGTCASLSLANRLPDSAVRYLVLLDLDEFDAPLRSNLTERAKRTLARVGPPGMGWAIRLEVEIHNIESWNQSGLPRVTRTEGG